MKQPTPTTLTAKCEKCLFGRPVTIIEREDAEGRKAATRKRMCECHVARPTRSGWPVVRLDDYCSHHVDRESGERTYAALVPMGGVQ